MVLQDIARFELDKAAAEARRDPAAGPIDKLFHSAAGRGVHKWLHYLEVYDRFFAPYRDHAVMLEIGVARGGSLELWRRYFGDAATLYGIDIDPECATRVSPPNQVRIGSQADAAFLAGVVQEMGAPNIILDDGSHIAEHQVASFRTLFPLLQVGGIYVIEDLHTSYWPAFGGGMRRPGTGIELAKALVDDQHAWYHDEPEIHAPRSQLGAIHFYDSIVVIEKQAKPSPAHYVSAG